MSGSITGDKFGFKKGDIVQEFGYDEDVNFDVREQLEKVTGEQLQDEEYNGYLDGVLAWWRADDGDLDDLIDYLLDCSAGLEPGVGEIWLAVPEHSAENHVPTDEVNEAAQVAGLSATTSYRLDADWTIFRITT